MLKKQFVFWLVALLTFTSSAPIGFAEPGRPQDSKKLEEIKQQISSAGAKTQLSVKLLNKSVWKGYVSQVTNDRFVLVDKKGARIRTISYDEIMKIGTPSRTRLFAVIGAVAFVGVVIAIEVSKALGG